MKKIFIPLVFLFGLIYSCSKDNINVTVGNEQGQDTYLGGSSSDSTSTSTNTVDSTSTSNKITKMYYDANVYSMYTRANSMSEIESGRYVSVYVYNSSNTTLVTSEQYKSSVGTLTPSSPSTTAMTLVTGTYNLFAPGVNTPAGTAVPTFSSTSITNLSNNIDYIWWSQSGLSVSGTSQNVTMNLKHCCTQVVIAFENSDGVSFSSDPTMSITASTTTDNTWSLLTGVISNSTAVETTYTNMPVSTSTSSSTTSSTTTASDTVYYGQIIMMPLELNGNMTAQFSVSLNSQPSAKYNVTLPVYQNNLQAGNAYIYKVAFKNNEVTFTNSVMVYDWISVDANSTPIIPTQIN